VTFLKEPSYLKAIARWFQLIGASYCEGGCTSVNISTTVSTTHLDVLTGKLCIKQSIFVTSLSEVSSFTLHLHGPRALKTLKRNLFNVSEFY
jgi:hypothetical protein